MSSVQIKIIIVDMIKILGNTYERSIAIAFGTVLFCTF